MTSPSPAEGVPLSVCPCCDSDELYIRKDFPQKLGLGMVIAVGVLSFVLFGMGQLLWAFGVLIAMLVLDAIVYMFVAKLTVCYRCRAEFRELPLHPEHQGFDLATAEKYRGVGTE